MRKHLSRGNAAAYQIIPGLRQFDRADFLIFLFFSAALIVEHYWQNPNGFDVDVFLFLATAQLFAFFSHQRNKNSPSANNFGFSFITRHDHCGLTLSVLPTDKVKGANISDQFLGAGLFDRLHVSSRRAYLKVLSDVFHSNMSHTIELLIRMKAPDYDFKAIDQYMWFEACFDVEQHTLTGSQNIVVRGNFTEILSKSTANSVRGNLNRLSLDKLAHELRTPLNAIIGFSELLADPKMVASGDPRRSEYTRIIATAGRHMLDIISEMGDCADDDFIFNPNSEMSTINDLVVEAIGMLSLSARAAKADISYSIDPQIFAPPGTQRYFRQILLNLISNSVKYAPAGKIHIHGSEADGLITVAITDNGIGVDLEDIQRLTEPYFRVGRDHRHLPDGQGLGLSVVQGVVDRLGGVLKFQSEPGKGTKVLLQVRSDGMPIIGDRNAMKTEYLDQDSTFSRERKRA